MGNFDNIPRVDFSYFNYEESSCYDNEKLLYSTLATESINNNGVKMFYFKTTFDTNRDKIFGEDVLRFIQRKFEIFTYFPLPEDDKIYNQFGINYVEQFKVFVTKMHFEQASTMSYLSDPDTSGSFISMQPRIGDFLKSEFDDKFYEIVNVQDTEQPFLNEKHTWELTVRAFKDDHLTISPETSAVPISSMDDIAIETDQDDILRVNEIVTSAMEDIRYLDINELPLADDPFGD